MNYDLEDLLRYDISDEAAYYLCEFVEMLSMMVSDRYFRAAERYVDDLRQPPPDVIIHSHKNEDDYPF